LGWTPHDGKQRGCFGTGRSIIHVLNLCKALKAFTSVRVFARSPLSVLQGEVTWVTSYGAFVNVVQPDGKKFEGLIHKSELSWGAVITPDAIVHRGVSWLLETCRSGYNNACNA
jgi:hypothetical protein